MKKLLNLNLLLFIGALFMVSCKEEIEVSVPDFDVETENNTYKINEEITFNFKGNPDFISFYSGEVGHDFNFKEGRLVEKGKIELSFNNNVESGTQANQFSVWASTNFNGNYSNISNVDAATWTEITNRFTLGTTSTFVNSGVADISDITEDGKPLYIAFKYTIRPRGTYGAWRVWRVQNYNLISQTSIGPITLADMLTSGFVIIEKDPSAAIKTRSSVTTATISLYPAVTTAENTNVFNEVWAVSAPVQTGVMDYGPDRPIPIKGSVTGYTREYKYTFTSPGTYKVYFVASNNNIYDAKEVVREMELNIVP